MIKSFSTYLSEEAKEIVFTFGRFNPPTNGHEKLLNKVASIASGNNYRIYASQSQDPKKNPLDFSTKIKIMRKMFPKHGRNIMADTGIRNVLDILVKLYDQGFTKVTMVVGSDRVNEFTALTNKYNGVKARHGMYNFESGINIVSAGERDPDSDDVSGMSASKMRAAAAANDFAAFSKGLPSGFKDSKEVFDTLRKAMGIKEAAEYKHHVQLESVSDEREQYVKGNLYNVGDIVVIKNTEEIAEVTMLGSNYVLVETSSLPKRTLRKWINDVEKIKIPPVDTDVDGDFDVLDLPKNNPVPDELTGTETGLEKDGTKRYRDKYDKEKLHTKKGVAYEEMPKSKHTKKFKDMFGEASGAETSLKDKADKTGISYSILKKVFDRGFAAWKSGHRPGTNPTQWGLARVNSFATGGKTRTTADADLWAKHKGK